MTEQQSHKLTLDERSRLTMNGVAEVLNFSEDAVVLKTALGVLTIHGQGLKLKNLSLDGGQVAVEGSVAALIYEENRPSGGWLRRIFG